MSARVPTHDADHAAGPVAPSAENDGTAAATSAVLYGVARGRTGGANVIWLPDPGPANDERGDDADALLAADPDFDAICDARRDAWIAAHERDSHDDATGADPSPDEEHDDDECT